MGIIKLYRVLVKRFDVDVLNIQSPVLILGTISFITKQDM